MSRWSGFDKRVEMVKITANYINQLNELNSTCNRQQISRPRRQIDNAVITAVDFGFKKIRENILNEQINELYNTENMSSKSKSKYCIFYFKFKLSHLNNCGLIFFFRIFKQHD